MHLQPGFSKKTKIKTMKKILIALTAVLCCHAMAVMAQITNPGFENWTSGDPDGWVTSNAFPAGLVNVTQTTDRHSGSYALRGEVVNLFGTPMGPVIQSGTGGTGFPISEQYHSFELFYKFTSIGGDKFSVNVGLEKAGNPVAQGAAALPATVGSYTHLTVPLTYMTGDVPDLAIIQISITGPVTGSDYHLGSVMFADDLLFSLSTGIDNNSFPGLNRRCFPDPATSIVNIPMSDFVSGASVLTIFDARGREVRHIAIHPQQNGKDVFQFSVEDFPAGLYLYSISGQNRIDRGKFTIAR